MPQPCKPGTYNPSGSGACTQCPAGQPCPYYGAITSQNGLFCAPGNYCPAKTSFPSQYPCPAGTYSDSISITDSSQCTQCPQSYACSEGTNTLTNVKVPCAPGYFCPAGTSSPTQHPCPAGTYSPATDNYQVAQCSTCPPGYYCLSGSSTPTGQCQAGYYCPQGSSLATQVPCPDGTYLGTTGAMALASCKACPLGSYCPSVSTTPTPCPAGYYGDYAHNELADDTVRTAA